MNPPLRPTPLPGCLRCQDFENLLTTVALPEPSSERPFPGSIEQRRAASFAGVLFFEHRREHDRIPFAEPENGFAPERVEPDPDPFPRSEAPTKDDLRPAASNEKEKSEVEPPFCSVCGCRWRAHAGHPGYCSNCYACKGYIPSGPGG
jgi:hypothetical protein